jgi:chemotaxis protein histidine kinase CheA/CheY-like chemotaxis protein
MAMDTEQRQRILGYFLEEAGDHLSTFEQGLLNFQETLRDPELINELFRAAHSIKGGAAMLELAPIQKIAHRLEDNLKVLKDNYRASFSAEIPILLTNIVGVLARLLDHVKQGKELSPAINDPILASIRPVLKTLERKIAESIYGETTVIEVANRAPKIPPDLQSDRPQPDRPQSVTSHPKVVVPTSSNAEESALHFIFKSDIPVHLRQMLQFFKCADENAVREELVRICDTLDRIGEQFELMEWCNLVGLIRIAIIDPTTSYPEIGAIVLRDLKQAQEKILKNAWQDIHASPELLNLLPAHSSRPLALKDDNFLVTDPPVLVSEESSTMMEDALDFDTSPLGQILNELDQSELPELESSPLPDLEADLDAPASDDMDSDDFNSLANLFGAEEDLWGSGDTAEDSLSEVDSLFLPDLEPDGSITDTTLESMPTDLGNLGDLGDLSALDAEDLALDDLFGNASEDLDQDLEAIGSEDSEDLEASLGFEENESHPEASSAYPLDDEITFALQNLPPETEPEEAEHLETEAPNETEDTSAGEWTFLWEETAKPETEPFLTEPAAPGAPEIPSLETDSAAEADLSDFDLGLEENEIDSDALLVEPAADLSLLDEDLLAEDLLDEETISKDLEIPDLSSSASDDFADLELPDQAEIAAAGLDDFADFDSFEETSGVADPLAPDLEISDLEMPDLEIPDLEQPLTSATDPMTEDLDEDLDPGFAAETIPQPQGPRSADLFDLPETNQDSAFAARSKSGLGWESFFEEETQIGEYPGLPQRADNLFGEAGEEPTAASARAIPPLAADFDFSVPSPAAASELPPESADWDFELQELEAGEEAIASADLEMQSTEIPDLDSPDLDLDFVPTPATEAFLDREADLEPDPAPSSMTAETSLDSALEAPMEDWDLDFGDSLSEADTGSDFSEALDLDSPLTPAEQKATILPETESTDSEATSVQENSEFDLELLGLDETFTGRISEDDRGNFTLTQDLSELDLEVEAPFDPELLPGGETLGDSLEEEFDLDLGDNFYSDRPGEDNAIQISSDPILGLEGNAGSPEDLPDFADLGDFAETDFGFSPNDNAVTDDLNLVSEESLLGDDLFDDIDSLETSEPAGLSQGWGDLDSILEAPDLTGSGDDFDGLQDFLDNTLEADSPSAGGGLEDLDALLDSGTGGNGQSSGLDDLDSLLSPSPSLSTPPQDTDLEVIPLDAELSDLMLQADMLGGPPVAAGLGQTGRRGAVTQQSMKVPVKQLDNLNNLVGEMVVNRNSLETDQERLRQSIDKLLYQVQQLGDVGQRLQDLYERSLLENALLASRQSVMSPPRSHGYGNHHNGDDGHDDGFDALEMDRFSGFHLLSQEMIELIVRVRESASDIDYIVNEPLDYVARNFRQVTTQLQEGLTRARMVPFEQGMTRLPRAVREVTGRCGKQATLILEGKETLVDKVLLEQLYNPMTHLVNNAVTHGIETPEERIKAGKSPEGTIQIQAFHQGNQTVIVVSDDGAGIDAERVRRKAIEKGLISRAEANTLNELQLYDFLFHPGFSTKDKADDFSGRGVGMDVVLTNLQNMRGSVSTDSVRGKGTTFTIRLPLTLSISKSLCCISNRARIAFPMDGVEDMLDVPEDRVQRNAQDQPCIQWRDQLIPFRPLSDLLHFNRQTTRSTVYGGSQDDDMLSIVILRTAGEYIALKVDRVEGEKEIVIKQLEGPIPKPTGIAGVTVMSDGQVMPIADVLELIDLAKGRSRQAPSMLWEQEPPAIQEDAPHEPMVLIVDDSIVVRELLSMTFNKAGYRVEQARDGQEAWEKLRSGLPCDIVFCDIEMPRMTGLELLEKLQKDQTLNKLPIAMLTSRGADRHRQMATQLGARGYFTKPYLEEALLEAAARMLKGEVLVGAAV